MREPMSIGQVIDELNRLKAMKAEDDRHLDEFRTKIAELRRDLETDMERFDRECGNLWLYGAFAFLGIALIGLAMAACR